MSSTTLKKDLKDLDIDLCLDESGGMTEKTVERLTAITLQHMFAKYGSLVKDDETILKCTDGELVMTQSQDSDDIYQMFSIRLGDDKIIPLTKIYWNNFKLMNVESYVKFNPHSESCFSELIGDLRLLGNATDENVPLTILFYELNRDVIEAVSGKYSEDQRN